MQEPSCSVAEATLPCRQGWQACLHCHGSHAVQHTTQLRIFKVVGAPCALHKGQVVGT